jgi:hypothetical protein
VGNILGGAGDIVIKESNKIETGSRVAVIGGGPAGSFFALYLLRFAGEAFLPFISCASQGKGKSALKSPFTNSETSMNEALKDARAALESSLYPCSGTWVNLISACRKK